MSAKTTTQQDRVLNWIRGTTFPSAPGTVYVALFTVAPTDAGGGTEVSGGSYARTAVTFGAPSAASPGEQIANSGAVVFPQATGSWGTVVAAALMDASSSGTMLYWANLTVNQTVNNTDQVQFATSALVVKEQ